MKRLVALFFLVLVAAAPAFVMQPAQAVTLGNNPSVTGHGNLTILGGLQTASFHAVQHQNGAITGSLVVKSRGQAIRLFADINCLIIVGNKATLSGVVTQTNNPAVLVGDGVWFEVMDNGEGANNPPDSMTDVQVFPPFVNCSFTNLSPLLPIEEGNIQVRP